MKTLSSGQGTAALSASCPFWRCRLLRPSSVCGFAGPLSIEVQPGSTSLSRGKLEGCRRALAEAITDLVAARDCRLVAGWLRAADCGGWRCLATVSAAWDCVVRWRLRQRHRATTGLAADCGGLLSLAGATRWGTMSEDGASDFLVLLFWRQWLNVRVKQKDHASALWHTGGCACR